MPGLSKEKRMELISAVKKYPILWVRDVKKSAKELNMTWDLVGREVRMDPTILREKWKYLTDTHRKEVYKHRYGNTGSRVSWPFIMPWSLSPTNIASRKSDKRSS
ncbi:Hypothetical protein FKW44_023645, partial [Caligus rogercresseyi]